VNVSPRDPIEEFYVPTPKRTQLRHLIYDKGSRAKKPKKKKKGAKKVTGRRKKGSEASKKSNRVKHFVPEVIQLDLTAALGKNSGSKKQTDLPFD
jgi:hypothetical protein